MKSPVTGFVLVIAAAAWRILGWPSGIESFVVWLFYVVGSALVVTYFIEGPKHRQWIGAPVAAALIALPMAITWIFRK